MCLFIYRFYPKIPDFNWEPRVAQWHADLQYSSLGLVLLVRLITSVSPDATLAVMLAKVAFARGVPTTPVQSGVFHGLLQYVHGSRLVMDVKK